MRSARGDDASAARRPCPSRVGNAGQALLHDRRAPWVEGVARHRLERRFLAADDALPADDPGPGIVPASR